ncbi:cytochrome o ubiquinol oxidase subunit IV [Bradyrhizobium barranii]|jgi:cytochrome o ubiquinol oxidase operon protein cyoD|uniref:cytochrome o ubiquinol oxidase subunit IV n=1 Tax=Bradyrhizobium barranii TaxID=2992140 RepID=UPI0024AED9B0|nr:cytochrome o ubiquinol oxidase subunit IV [Bradyrhizobium barranii]WFT93491.1 cytochrome o ubiquinol oxidase subunit IV [Bradyrhizobium barranii]
MSSASHSTSRSASHGTVKSYVVGFILSLGLTALSFGAVMSGTLPRDMILPAITLLAVVQLLIQLICFLHLGTAPEQRNNTMIFILTGSLIATIVGGSLWVMHNANVNMMPTQISPERARVKD